MFQRFGYFVSSSILLYINKDITININAVVFI
nr:MAG TPA: hypothetical protein [Caudoviricetes sp.]